MDEEYIHSPPYSEKNSECSRYIDLGLKNDFEEQFTSQVKFIRTKMKSKSKKNYLK